MGKQLNFEIFIWLNEKIKKGKYPSKLALMDKFELKDRTAQRAIEFMKDKLKLPIKYSRENGGYYYSEPCYNFPTVQFTEKEIIGLIVSERLSHNIPNEVIHAELNSFIEKFSIFTGVDVNKLKKKISIKNMRYDKVDPKVFEMVIWALNNNLKIKIEYKSKYKDEITSRIVSPIHLLLYMGNWHIFAFCELRGKLRNFALSGIKKIEACKEPISNELLQMNIATAIEENYGIYIHEDEVNKVEVVLKFNREISEIVKSQIWFPHQNQKQNDDGSIIFSFPVSDFREILGDILRYGADVEVLEPVELKEMMKQTILKMKQIY